MTAALLWTRITAQMSKFGTNPERYIFIDLELKKMSIDDVESNIPDKLLSELPAQAENISSLYLTKKNVILKFKDGTEHKL
ncbi:MAG: hypothetical protein GYA62_15340 [Bacteroidales bacterium]|nr:hypothetical protein [Bacteroidales bacterium]